MECRLYIREPFYEVKPVCTCCYGAEIAGLEYGRGEAGEGALRDEVMSLDMMFSPSFHMLWLAGVGT